MTNLRTSVMTMTRSLAHRGPDGEGIWSDDDVPLVLGHRRLAILDLTDRGLQPLRSPDGRIVISYNGEVYNHLELRKELEDRGVRFNGSSDTETVAAAISQWGLPEALRRFVGMFALAAWMPAERRLFLARDRFGVKPLYYRVEPNRSLVFTSELRALEATRTAGEIDPGAVGLYLKFGYVPAPYSIYRGLWKLPPGTWLEISANAAGLPGTPRLQRYWRLPSRPDASQVEPDFDEAKEEIRSALSESVKLRMLSDVPLGAFLSGGIDSSLVVATMRAVSATPVRTFTIGFSDPGWPDESARAAEIARRLDTEHTNWVPEPDDLRSAAERMPQLFDEPFADPSMIPTFLVSTLARRHVTVALSGDGGDEGFLGYDRYAINERMLRRYRWLSKFGPRRSSERLFDLSRDAAYMPRWAHRLTRRLRAVLAAASPETFYEWSVGADISSATMLRPEFRGSDFGIGGDRLTSGSEDVEDQAGTDGVNRRDLTRYLPDDIMFKVDRASMSVGLEAREPLLDHRLVETALRLPRDFRRPANGPGKRILRALLAEHLPGELIDGPKRGFGAPIGTWLAGPVRGWAADHMASEDDILDRPVVDRLSARWLAGQSGAEDVERLWRVVMLRAWLAGRRATVARTPSPVPPTVERMDWNLVNGR